MSETDTRSVISPDDLGIYEQSQWLSINYDHFQSFWEGQFCKSHVLRNHEHSLEAVFSEDTSVSVSSNPKQRAARWKRGRGPSNTCTASGYSGTKATRPAGKYSTLTVPFPLAGASSLPFSFAASAASSTTSFFSFKSWNEADVFRLINKPSPAT